MKKILLVATAIMALGTFSAQAGNSASHNWNTGSTADIYKAALGAAKAEQKLANKLGFEWKNIGKFLKDAAKLHKSGDVKGALALVAKARQQAILGQNQAADQANAGPRF